MGTSPACEQLRFLKSKHVVAAGGDSDGLRGRI